MDFIVLTRCSLVGGYKVLEEQGRSAMRMWFDCTFRPSSFTGVISKSHAERLVMQSAFEPLLSTAKWCPSSPSFREKKESWGVANWDCRDNMGEKMEGADCRMSSDG